MNLPEHSVGPRLEWPGLFVCTFTRRRIGINAGHISLAGTGVCGSEGAAKGQDCEEAEELHICVCWREALVWR